jgi:hypothetical protein
MSARDARVGVAAACLCALLAGCASERGGAPTAGGQGVRSPSGRGAVVSADDRSGPVVSTVYQGQYAYVRIERAEPPAGGPNDHPASLAPADVRAALAALEVERRGSGRRPVFTKGELDELAAPLAAALAAAGPEEDVTFAVTARRAPLVPQTVTTGRLFYGGGRLNVIFGLVREEFEGEFLATGHLRPFTPGSRARPVERGFRVLPGGASGATAEREDWIALALAGDRAATAPGTAPSSEAPPDARARDVEQRLRTLDGLKEKGLITEEEYREKRRAILNEL